MNKRYRLKELTRLNRARFTTGLLLAVLVGLVIPGSLPAPVQAQDEVIVNVWIGNIVSGEGLNPEPETDTEGEGELDDWLLFNLSTDPAGRLDTNIGLPTTINNFPQPLPPENPDTPLDPFIRVTLLNASDTVNLTWEWVLPCETGNEAQGDTLSFDIFYGIEAAENLNLVVNGEGATGLFFMDIKPCMSGSRTVTLSLELETTPGGNGGPLTTQSCECNINILDETYEVRIDCCNNTVTGTRIYLDPDKLHFLEIVRGTALICGDCLECGKYPRWIVMSVLEDPPPAPEWLVQLGPAYELIGYSDEDMEHECTSVIFGKPVILLLNYEHYDYGPVELPEGTSAVIIAYYDTELGMWMELLQDTDTGRIAGFGEVTAVLNHLSTFAVFAKLSSPSAPPEPSPPQPTVTPPSPPLPAAHFVLSDLSIVPDKQLTALGRFFTFVARSGESVTVTANVANDGGQEGSYTARLQIDGNTVATKDINLSPGQNQELVFSIVDSEPGRHKLQIGDIYGEFQTSVWVNWWLIAGIATTFGFLVWLAWYYGYRRRKLS